MNKEDIKQIKKAVIEAVGPYFRAIQGDFAKMDGRMDRMEQRLDVIEVRLARLESGYENIRVEIREIRHLLLQKASVEELNELNMRVMKIESRLKKAGVL